MSRQKIPYARLKPEGVKDASWKIVVEAWENGLSDREAAFRTSKYADIEVTVEDIKAWVEKNPDIGELRAGLHCDVLSNAKINVAKALKSNDVATSKWYLERKAADEFSTKQAVAFENAVVVSLEEKKKQLQEFVEQFDGE